jgi:Stage II sporulation protein M
VTARSIPGQSTTLWVAAALTAATLVVAVAVRIGCAADARARLAFPFGGVPARAATAVSIFVNNAIVLGAIFAAAAIVQSPWIVRADPVRARVAVVVLVAVDTVLALEVTLNVVLVGAAFGAYGTRMAVAVLPHGPLELAAFARGLALYVNARRAPLATRHAVGVAAGCLAALALAAMLETFAAP